MQELKLMIDDLPKAKDRAALAPQLSAIETRQESISKQYREAVITSKRVIETTTHLSEREQLFATSSPAAGEKRMRPAKPESGEDALMAATSEVTEGLRRTLNLLQQTLDTSLVAADTLSQSTLSMSMTSDQYSTFSTLLTTSKSLITSMERADVLDRLLLALAFLFFLACCAWVVKRRVVDKGIKVVEALAGVAGKGGSAKKVVEAVKHSLVERDPMAEATRAASEAFAAVTTTAAAIVASVSSKAAIPSAQTTSKDDRNPEVREFSRGAPASASPTSAIVPEPSPSPVAEPIAEPVTADYADELEEDDIDDNVAPPAPEATPSFLEAIPAVETADPAAPLPPSPPSAPEPPSEAMTSPEAPIPSEYPEPTPAPRDVVSEDHIVSTTQAPPHDVVSESHPDVDESLLQAAIEEVLAPTEIKSLEEVEIPLAEVGIEEDDVLAADELDHQNEVLEESQDVAEEGLADYVAEQEKDESTPEKRASIPPPAPEPARSAEPVVAQETAPPPPPSEQVNDEKTVLGHDEL